MALQFLRKIVFKLSGDKFLRHSTKMNDSLDMANFDIRIMTWRHLEEVHIEILHIKVLKSNLVASNKKIFHVEKKNSMFFSKTILCNIKWPLGRGLFLPRGHDLKNILEEVF